MSTSPVSLDFTKAEPLTPTEAAPPTSSGGVTLDFSKAQPLNPEMTMPGTGQFNDVVQRATNTFTGDLGVPKDWSIGNVIQGAKQKWADLQASRDAEAQMSDQVVNHIKQGNYGQATELLLQHLLRNASPIGGNVLEAGKSAVHGQYPEAAGHLMAGAAQVGGALAGAEAPEALAGGETAEGSPGIIKQLVKGRDVAQEPAQQSLRTAAGTQEASLRTSLEKPIALAEKAAKDSYKAIDEATGGKFQPNADALKNINMKLREVAGIDDAKEAELMAKKVRLEWQQENMFDEAAQKGVSRDVVDTAKTQFKKAQALQDLETKVFKNPSIISGNVAHGAEESIDIDKALRALQKLEDNTEFGGSRLEQAIGKDATDRLMNELYRAQRLGQKAVTKRWIAGTIAGGVPVAGEGIRLLSGKP